MELKKYRNRETVHARRLEEGEVAYTPYGALGGPGFWEIHLGDLNGPHVVDCISDEDFQALYEEWPEDEEETPSYKDQTNEALRTELEARGLPITGNKDALIARLEESDHKKSA